VKKLGESVSKLQGRVTELEKDKAGLTRERDELTKERDALTKERDELKVKVAEQQVGNATLASQIIKLEERAKAAARERTELVAKPSVVEQPRDELAAKPTSEPSRHEPSRKEILDEGKEGDGADSTPPSSPTGVVIHRLAFGGNLPPASSPKSGPPGLGILGQNHRPPTRGSANKKHKRR
jgi:septal ring factor EnvC (AmiA/AmiB activator)